MMGQFSIGASPFCPNRRPARWSTFFPKDIFLPLLLPLLSLLLPAASANPHIRMEVVKRVREHLLSFMSNPNKAANLIVAYHRNGGLERGVDAPGRDSFLRINDALRRINPQIESVFYGSEDGMSVGTMFHRRVGRYREPGESGYDPSVDADMIKHYISCMGRDGSQENCTMDPGAPYIECIDDCELVKCPDDESQRDCSSEVIADDEERRECEERVRWCRSYAKKRTPQIGEGPRLGFVPNNWHCLDEDGVVSQKPGAIIKENGPDLGSCYFLDGETLVNRTLSGTYAFCGDDGETCDDTFAGAFDLNGYEPRLRGWYENTRARQRENWSPPYSFFIDGLDMGMTYSAPIYSTEEGRTIFRGAVGVDYTLWNITQNLVESYSNTKLLVAVFEDVDPYYMIGSSTGSEASLNVLVSDNTQPCLDRNSGECKAVRVNVLELSGHPMDDIVAKAFRKQRKAGFPIGTTTVKGGGDVFEAFYTSETKTVQIPQMDALWRIMAIHPTELKSGDTIMPEDSLFVFVVVIAVVGLGIGLFLFYQFFSRRAMRAVIVSDWRFTSAFIMGCTLMNAAILSFLGPNANELCMLRMWLFHALFAMTISPSSSECIP